jgi:hypothetical protein
MGGEFINLALKEFLSQHRMIHQTSCSYTPQQNGVAERKNRTLLDIARALLIDSHTPAYFWPEALATATYLTNRLPSKPLAYKTPLATLGSFVPLPSHHSLPPRIFGCVVFVHLPKQCRTKLEPRALKCVFVGYGVHKKGYSCFVPVHNRMYTTMDCDFFEDHFYYTQHSSQGKSGSDDLSWHLNSIPPVVTNMGPKEKVSDTTDVVSDHIVSPLQCNLPPSDEHPSSPEVCSEPEPIHDIDDVDDSIVPAPVSESNKYELPPRSTRGIPPRRYDPDFEAQRSGYPVNRESNQVLSQSALAFNTSLYSNDIPRNVEEALQDQKWKKKSWALTKMKHGNSARYQRVKELWDVDGCIQSSIELMVRLNDIRQD